MTFKVFIGMLLITVFSLTHSINARAKYKDEYKMSVIVGPSYPWSAGAFRFAKLVKERTDGRVNIKVYPSSSLMAGKQTNEFLFHRRGIADFTFASTISWSVALKPLNLFNLPFFFDSYAHVDAVKEGEAGDEIKKLLKHVGITFLAWGESGFRELTSRKSAITTPDDMQGVKIRVIGTPLFLDTMRILGADPVGMNWVDAQVAFKNGLFEAQENPINAINIPVKIWQYFQYATIWHHVIDPLMFTANNKIWDSFSKQDQKIIQVCAKQAGRVQLAVARAGLTPDDYSALNFLREKGMQVTVLNAQQRQVFRDKVQPVYDKWVQIIGEDLVAKARMDMASVR